MNQYNALRLTMFSGKGGVGKTTLSCGFARRWARLFSNEQVLLISTDPAHSLGDVLQMTVEDTPHPLEDLPNLQVQSLNAENLLKSFKDRYSKVLELLVERGSFVQGEDLTPVWDLRWPGLDELMGILEIQRLLRERIADHIVVDMAPSGHTINLFGLMDFLDTFLNSLDLFQEKHRLISQSFTGRHTEDDADRFLVDMKSDLASGRALLQDTTQTTCLVVAIPEPMSLLETQRFLEAIEQLHIPCGGIFVNHLLLSNGESPVEQWDDQQIEQAEMVKQFLAITPPRPVFAIPEQEQEPVGGAALDHLLSLVEPIHIPSGFHLKGRERTFPAKIPPGFSDFITDGRRLILVGGKGGVGKTTVSAAIAWGMADRHPDKKIRVISIDPAHSLGDALGERLGHEARSLTNNLTAQEVDVHQVLDQFRDEYLWELAEMISGDTGQDDLQLAYGPEAWRQIIAQALPGIDEMLSLMTVMELLEKQDEDLIILDTAPTGHLLRFLEMPTAMGDWLAWIFKLWIKYQDTVGRTEFMGRLRSLRQRVMQAQKKLKDSHHTEFIEIVQAKRAILAEAERLAQCMTRMGISQRYLVHNHYIVGEIVPADRFPNQTIVRLPLLPRAIAPIKQIQGAAKLLF